MEWTDFKRGKRVVYVGGYGGQWAQWGEARIGAKGTVIEAQSADNISVYWDEPFARGASSRKLVRDFGVYSQNIELLGECQKQKEIA